MANILKDFGISADKTVMVDGVFIGRYIGTNGLAAINLIWPLFGVLLGLVLAYPAIVWLCAKLHIYLLDKEK